MPDRYDVAIVGGGIIGLATAHTVRELLTAGAERAIPDFEGFTWPV